MKVRREATQDEIEAWSRISIRAMGCPLCYEQNGTISQKEDGLAACVYHMGRFRAQQPHCINDYRLWALHTVGALVLFPSTCPECGCDFPVYEDYICEECRAKVA